MDRFWIKPVNRARLQGPMPQVVVGRIRPVFKVLKSPVAGKICVYYKTVVYEQKYMDVFGNSFGDGYWVEQFSEENSVDYFLKDEVAEMYIPKQDYKRFGVEAETLENSLVIRAHEKIPPSIQKMLDRNNFESEQYVNGEKKRKVLRFEETWIVLGQKTALIGVLKYIVSPVHDADDNGYVPKTFALAPVDAGTLDTLVFNNFVWTSFDRKCWYSMLANLDQPVILFTDDPNFIENVKISEDPVPIGNMLILDDGSESFDFANMDLDADVTVPPPEDLGAQGMSILDQFPLLPSRAAVPHRYPQLIGGRVRAIAIEDEQEEVHRTIVHAAFSGKPCVYYMCMALQFDASKGWETVASESVSVDFYLCDGGAQPIFVYGSDVEASISSKPHFMVCSKDNPEEVSYLKDFCDRTHWLPERFPNGRARSMHCYVEWVIEVGESVGLLAVVEDGASRYNQSCRVLKPVACHSLDDTYLFDMGWSRRARNTWRSVFQQPAILVLKDTKHSKRLKEASIAEEPSWGPLILVPTDKQLAFVQLPLQRLRFDKHTCLSIFQALGVYSQIQIQIPLAVGKTAAFFIPLSGLEVGKRFPVDLLKGVDPSALFQAVVDTTNASNESRRAQRKRLARGKTKLKRSPGRTYAMKPKAATAAAGEQTVLDEVETGLENVNEALKDLDFVGAEVLRETRVVTAAIDASLSWFGNLFNSAGLGSVKAAACGGFADLGERSREEEKEEGEDDKNWAIYFAEQRALADARSSARSVEATQSASSQTWDKILPDMAAIYDAHETFHNDVYQHAEKAFHEVGHATGVLEKKKEMWQIRLEEAEKITAAEWKDWDLDFAVREAARLPIDARSYKLVTAATGGNPSLTTHATASSSASSSAFTHPKNPLAARKAAYGRANRIERGRTGRISDDADSDSDESYVEGGNEMSVTVKKKGSRTSGRKAAPENARLGSH